MSFRLPSQNKAFKPSKPASPRRPAQRTSVSAPSASQPSSSRPDAIDGPNAPSASQVPALTQSSTQATDTQLATPSTPSAPSTSSQLPPASTPSIPTPTPTPDFVVPPPKVRADPPAPTPPPAVRGYIPPTPRVRQPSLAPSASSSVLRSGKSALLAAAEHQAASGFTRPSPGRIDSKSARAAADRAKAAAAARAGPSGPSTPSAPSTPAATSTPLPPSQTPTSPAPSAPGLPPSIATSSGLPPTLATDAPQASTSASTSTSVPATPSADLDAKARAEAIVASIQRVRGSAMPVARRVGKRDTGGIVTSKRVFKDKTTKPINKPRKRKASEAGEDEDEPEEGEGESSQAGPSRGLEGVILTRPRRRRTAKGDGEDGEPENAENGVITKKLGRKRGPYKSAGLAGTSMDRRLSANRKKKEEQIKFIGASLTDVEPGERIGDVVDVNVLTMGELATEATHGKVSARGIKLAEFSREIASQRKREFDAKRATNWRQQQIHRRKLRSIRNAQRGRRREGFIERGEDPDAYVSEDEVDSEEEYDIIPDRLTPPPEPQRVPRIEPLRIGPRAEETQPETSTTFEAPEVETGVDFELPEWAYEDVAPEQAAEGEGAENDEDADLRAAGISVVANGAEGGDEGAGDENGGEDDEDEDEDDEEEPDWNQFQEGYDADAYRDDIAEQQRRNLEDYDSRAVVEDDDETKMVNGRTFARLVPTERWTEQDTEMFYAVLGETGLNPTMLKTYFPGRTQKQLKNKMNRELHKDPTRVYAALDQRKAIDVEFLKKSVGYDPDRGWEREEALLEEARRDKERLASGDLDLPAPEEGQGQGLEEGDEAMEDEDEQDNHEEEEEEEVYPDGQLFFDGPGAGSDVEDAEEAGEDA